MDLATLSALAEQLAPLVLQKIKGKGKKEVSELNTVSDYSNIYSMPCFYWNKETGEKKAVNLAMEAIVQSLEDAANEELIAIKQAATEAKESALESSSQAAEAERKATDAAEYALQQKEATELYLTTVQQKEEERQTAESERAIAEAARSQAETARRNAETIRRNQEADRVEAEQARVIEFNTIKTTTERAATAANNAAASANKATEDANAATLDSIRQTGNCEEATDLAAEVCANPPRINERGYWEIFDTNSGTYVETPNYALGGATYPIFGVDDEGFIYVESTEDDAERFSVDEDGFLVVNF